jgi:hypothetical protein
MTMLEGFALLLLLREVLVPGCQKEKFFLISTQAVCCLMFLGLQ